jgi:hypothetical protein
MQPYRWSKERKERERDGTGPKERDRRALWTRGSLRKVPKITARERRMGR